ncbi:MAG TPA: thiamine phosphate synthase [Gemmatimonadaceae bacterium]|nr:thiamine phosphate synthase [Gemmatimonadaceae bacterium]
MNDSPHPATSGSGVPSERVPVVHAVTDDLILTRPTFAERALDVMQALGARGAVHLRARIIPSRRLLSLAEALRLAQQETGCWLIINDRIDLALAVGARGVQLTSRSIRVADGRRIAPNMKLGASVHTVDQAHHADRDGADWLVAGHVFDTSSHAGVPGRGVPFLRAVCAASSLPVLAIGGVTPALTTEVRRTGAHGVAVIRGIWSARDAERAARDYLSAYDADGSRAASDRRDSEW